MSTQFVNMTPHAINLMTESGKSITTLEPSGSTIRLDEEWSSIGSFGIHSETFDDTMIVPLLHCEYSSGSIPEPVEDTIFIVSAMVANAYPDRYDFVMVAKTVRDDNGRIIGCHAFACATDFLKTKSYEVE